MDQKLRNRIEAKLAEPDENGCKIWQGALNSNGLGVISKDGKVQQVRRVVFEEYVAPLTMPFVRTTCGNARCCTPEHLFQSVVPNDAGMLSGHWHTPANEPSPRTLTAFGETKTVHEWLLDSRCVVNAAVLWSRIRDMDYRKVHNERWKDHPTFSEGWSARNPWGYKKPTWTEESAISTPKRKKLTQWEI